MSDIRKMEVVHNVEDTPTAFGHEDTITVYQAKDNHWYWHRQSFGNNKILSDGSEGCVDQDEAVGMVKRCNRGPYRLLIEK